MSFWDEIRVNKWLSVYSVLYSIYGFFVLNTTKKVSSMELIDKVIQFSGKSVLLKLVAKVLGKDYQFVKHGIAEGHIPIGCSFKMLDNNSYTTYISLKLFYEYTGHIISEEEIDDYNRNNKQHAI